MFKRNLLTVFVATAAAGFGSFAMNAGADSDTGTANATIQTPLSIANDLTMEFGSIAPDAAGGTVTMSAITGNTTGPANFVIDNTISQAGQFTVTAEPGLAFDITFPGTPSLDDGVGGGLPMALSNFTASVPLTGYSLIGPGTSQAITIGADLAIGANQVPAFYSGVYTVQVDYQ